MLRHLISNSKRSLERISSSPLARLLGPARLGDLRCQFGRHRLPVKLLQHLDRGPDLLRQKEWAGVVRQPHHGIRLLQGVDLSHPALNLARMSLDAFASCSSISPLSTISRTAAGTRQDSYSNQLSDEDAPVVCRRTRLVSSSADWMLVV
jgi:hypothetical protein